MYATFPAHLILLDLIALITIGEAPHYVVFSTLLDCVTKMSV